MDKIKANKTVKRQGAGRPKIIVDIEILKIIYYGVVIILLIFYYLADVGLYGIKK